ncbi:UAA transporter family-domain-containing protein, partial [Mycena pura]
MVVSVDWFTTLSLIFGGCCSNAITLEQLTTQYPLSGSLITFLQFLIISLHGIPTHVVWTKYGPHFKPHRIPLTPYLVQVALFYLISLLNNAAFAYRIPMSVHIIFRSGGLVISMLLGWLVGGKRYTFAQVGSVLLVTLGVVLTTLSASTLQSTSEEPRAPRTYVQGISILTLALLLSGFLGLAQDYTYTRYGRPPLGSEKPATSNPPPTWQESMFYLHFLALPMFFFVRHDILSQLQSINTGPRSSYSVPVPRAVASALTLPAPFSAPLVMDHKSWRPLLHQHRPCARSGDAADVPTATAQHRHAARLRRRGAQAHNAGQRTHCDACPRRQKGCKLGDQRVDGARRGGRPNVNVDWGGDGFGGHHRVFCVYRALECKNEKGI